MNSNFNLDNETRFDDEIEGETDKQLYESIWKVQDIFRSPNGIYETDKYKQFEEAINKITDTFKNYKLGMYFRWVGIKMLRFFEHSLFCRTNSNGTYRVDL